MKYRVSEILASKTLAASGTEVIDLKVKDPISAILFEYKNTRGSLDSVDHVAGCLSKIELIDGSDVIFSLSGKQMHALDYYHNRQAPYTFLSNYIGVMQMLGLGYNFGRKLWDPLLAFDPKRFENPQLKITHNRVTCDASSSAHSLRILGMLFDEKAPSPIGFLSAREIMAYTSGANGSYKYIDLPTDREIRNLLLYGYDDAYSPYSVISQIKISEDNDKRVVMDEPGSLWTKQLVRGYPPFWESVLAYLSSTEKDFYCTPGFNITPSGIAGLQAAVLDLEAGTLHSPFEIGSNSGPGHDAKMQITGWLPHSVFAVPFGDQQDIDDWYDVREVGSLQAILKAGGAGTDGAVAVFLQQLRRN